MTAIGEKRPKPAPHMDRPHHPSTTIPGTSAKSRGFFVTSVARCTSSCAASMRSSSLRREEPALARGLPQAQRADKGVVFKDFPSGRCVSAARLVAQHEVRSRA